ncbi:MAG: PD-(D/E)XK nuclease family protein [Candidatus Kapaibacterium sp.]
MAQWVVSSDSSDLTRALQAETSLQVMTSLSDAAAIVIVPTARQRPRFLRAWLREYPQREAPMVMTMAQFIKRYGQQAMPGGPRILHESAVDVLLRDAGREHPAVMALGVQAEKIVRWTQHEADPESVERLAAQIGRHTRKGRLLAELSEVWQRLYEIYGSRGCDRGMYARLLADRLSESSIAPYMAADGRAYTRLVMLDTHGVTPVDRRLLDQLVRHGWNVGIRFCSEPLPMAELPSSTTSSDILWFVAQGWQAGGEQAQPQPATTQCAVLPSRIDEVRSALAMVRSDVGSGIPLGRMVLCIAGSSAYRRLLVQEAERMGVPITATSQRPLSASRIASAVNAVCRVLTGGWQRIDVERMFRDPLLERFRSRGGADVVEIARRDRIRGGEGINEWLDRLAWGEQATRQARERAEETGSDDVWARLRSVREYVRAQEVVRRLAELLNTDPSVPVSVKTFTTLVGQTILDEMGLIDVLDEALGSRTQGDILDAESELRAVTALKDVLEFYRGVAEDHDLADVPLGEHVSRWWAMVEATSIEDNAPKRGVPVLSPAEMRSIEAEHVIVLGFVEGEFPRSTSHLLDDEIIPDALRRLNVEAMADILSAADGRRLTLMRPTRVDDSLTITSSLRIMLPRDCEGYLQPPTLSRQNTSTHPIESAYRPSQSVVAGSALPSIARPLYEEECSRRMSASRLDEMQKCPYRYFATKVLRLDTTTSDDARLTPLERGNVLHELIATFFQRVRPLPEIGPVTVQSLLERRVMLQRARSEQYWQMLCELVDEYAERHAWTHTFAEVERHTLVGSSNMPGLLLRWLELEITYQEETGHAPALFEIVLNEDITIEIDGRFATLPITARIDRVDLAPDGEGVSFIVGDYKPRASSGYTTQRIMNGELSQMPIYLRATSEWLTRHNVPNEPLAAMYRSFGTTIHETDDPRVQMVLYSPAVKHWKDFASIKQSQRPKAFADILDMPLQQQVDATLVYADALAESIRAGVFPVQPTASVCEHCRMNELCRVDEWGIVGVSPQENEE